MAVAADLVVDIGLEMEFVGENLKSDQSAIVAALGFRFNCVLGYERCGGLVVVAGGTEILFSFGHDNLTEERDRELFREGTREPSTKLLMSQADNDTLVETVSICGNMDHHKTWIRICGHKKRRCVRLRMVLRGRTITKEKVEVFHEASLGLGLLNDG